MIKYLMINRSLVAAFCVFCFSCGSPSLPLNNLPKSVPLFDVKINRGDVFDGYIFLKKTSESGAHLMINSLGQVMWYLESDTVLFRPFRPYEKTFITMHSGNLIYEIEYSGDTLKKWKYDIDDGYKRSLHHDMLIDESGDLIALTYKYVPVDSTFNDSIRVDGIVKYLQDGESKEVWSLDNLDSIFTIVKNGKFREAYANALEIDTDGNYLLSMKNLSQVWKVDAKNGRLIWIYGDRKSLPENEWINLQHAVTKKYDGDYMVFDNGRGNSRAFGFNRSNEKFVATMSIELPDSLFSFKMGSVYQFARDRYLFCSPGSKSLIVTNSEGEILWLATSNHPFYRAYYLSPNVLD